jgi:TPR repeat protein
MDGLYTKIQQAESGDAEAQYEVAGYCLGEGRDEAELVERGLEYLTMAVNSHFPAAYRLLGDCMRYGIGIAVDYAAAASSYFIGGFLGESKDEDCVRALADMYRAGEYLEPDSAAADYLRPFGDKDEDDDSNDKTAAMTSLGLEQIEMGDRCLAGDGVAKAAERAFAYFAKAAALGCWQGFYRLSRFFASDDTEKKDDVLWFRSLRAANSLMDYKAQRCDPGVEVDLGHAYDQGIGTAIDKDKGFYHLQSGAVHYRYRYYQGDESVRQALRNLEGELAEKGYWLLDVSGNSQTIATWEKIEAGLDSLKINKGYIILIPEPPFLDSDILQTRRYNSVVSKEAYCVVEIQYNHYKGKPRQYAFNTQDGALVKQIFREYFVERKLPDISDWDDITDSIFNEKMLEISVPELSDKQIAPAIEQAAFLLQAWEAGDGEKGVFYSRDDRLFHYLRVWLPLAPENRGFRVFFRVEKMEMTFAYHDGDRYMNLADQPSIDLHTLPCLTMLVLATAVKSNNFRTAFELFASSAGSTLNELTDILRAEHANTELGLEYVNDTNNSIDSPYSPPPDCWLDYRAIVTTNK